MEIIQYPSPNYYDRSGYTPDLIVVHCTKGNWPSDRDWLCNPVSSASSHYIISPNGEVSQLVSDEKAAWHAGRIDHPTAKLKKNNLGVFVNPNRYTIGVEVSLIPPAIMPDEQKKSLLELIKTVADKYKIPLDRDHIVGHKEIYSLKTCPGTINVDDLVKELNTSSNSVIKSQIIELLNKIQ